MEAKDRANVMTPREAAYHEAGHFVVGWFERRTPSYCSIRAKDDSAGRTYTGRESFDFSQVRMKRECRICLAGIQAAGWLEEFDDHAEDWGAGDIVQAAEIAATSGDADRFLEERARETADRVALLWPAIDLLASVLLARTIVYRRMGQRLIRTVLPERPVLRARLREIEKRVSAIEKRGTK